MSDHDEAYETFLAREEADDWREQHQTSELEKARQRQSECASVQGGDDFGQEEEPRP